MQTQNYPNVLINVVYVSCVIEISDYLNIPLGEILVNQFNDGEVNVEVSFANVLLRLKKIKEEVRGKDVYLIQPTVSP